MGRAWPWLRMVALLGAGSALVHELRYVLGYGDFAQQALLAQGHFYLTWLEALTAVLLVGAGACFAASLLRARRGLPEHEVSSFWILWLRAGLALASIYTVQEGLEGALAPGHPAGVVGIFGHGGWTALLLSALIGGLIAAILRATYHAIRYVAERSGRRRGRARATPPKRAGAPAFARCLDVLACNLAGRAPPLHS